MAVYLPKKNYGKKLTAYRGLGMATKDYKIKYTYSSREDIREKKEYIIQTFKYRQFGKNFTDKIKAAARSLKTLPMAYITTGFQYRGYDIYLKPYMTYLLLYIVKEESREVTILRVLQDGQDWQYILKRWLEENTEL